MDKKKIANNILEFLVDPTRIPPQNRLYFGPNELLDNRIYEEAKASALQAYRGQRYNSDFYPLKNRQLTQREGSIMDQKTIIASLDILSQNFKENDPIAKDLRTMAYAVAKMSPEDIIKRMAEEAPQDFSEKLAGNPWIDHVKKTKKENPKLSLKEVITKAKKTYKKAEDEAIAEEEVQAAEEVLASEETAGDIDSWNDKAASAVQRALTGGYAKEDDEDDESEKSAAGPVAPVAPGGEKAEAFRGKMVERMFQGLSKERMPAILDEFIAQAEKKNWMPQLKRLLMQKIKGLGKPEAVPAKTAEEEKEAQLPGRVSPAPQRQRTGPMFGIKGGPPDPSRLPAILDEWISEAEQKGMGQKMIDAIKKWIPKAKPMPAPAKTAEEDVEARGSGCAPEKKEEEKEAGKKKPGVPDGTGPMSDTPACPMTKKKEAEETPEETEEEKKKAESTLVNTDILATIEFDGIQMESPMVSAEEAGEMSDEEKARLSQLFI